MNARQQRQSPNNTNNVQDKLSMDLIKSQELLNHLKRLIKQSKAFNKQAREYVGVQFKLSVVKRRRWIAV